MPQTCRSLASRALLIISSLGAVLCTPLAATGADRTFTVRVFGNPNAPSMLFMPGLMSAGDVWDATAEHFAADYRVHLLSLAGFAGTPPIDADPFLAHVRDDVIEYITSEHLDRPVIVGHSLGAFLALWIASTAPDGVRAVIAVDGVPFLPALSDAKATARDVAERAAQMRTILRVLTPSQLGAQSGVTARTQVSDPSHVARLTAWASTSHPPTVAQALAELLTTDLREIVAAIRAPVLLVASAMGTPEELLAQTLERYQAQVSRVHDVTVIAARRARHFIMLDDPDFLHAETGRFLAVRVAAPTGR